MAQSAPAPPGQPRPRYIIAADIDFAGGTIRAKETIYYTNRTPSTLNEIVFTVIPAHFDSFTLLSAKVNGADASSSLQDITLEVKLPKTLEPGDSAILDLEFTLQVPQAPSRFGYSDGVMALGNWYPILAVYRTERMISRGQPLGWDRHRYGPTGDPFFTEVADYQVEVTISEPLVVAYSGRLITHEGNRWSLEAVNVRDFALALSPRYRTQSATVGGVEITAYFVAEHAAAGAEYLTSAQEMLTWLGREISPYPYERLAVVEVPGITYSMEGQEYPQMVFITSALSSKGGGITSYLSWIVIHEVAHQWFYGVVGNDQLYEPWLDETLATWLSAQFYRANYPSLFSWMWEVHVASLLRETTAYFGVFPVNSSTYDFSSDAPYFASIYRRGATFLEQARDLMGEGALMSALREYFATFRYRIASGAAFLDILQANTANNLSPLIARYFTYPQYGHEQPLSLSLRLEEGKEGFAVHGEATADIDKIAALLDGMPIGAGVSSSSFIVELPGISAGDHLLTVTVADAQGRITERSLAFEYRPAPQPTPTATLMPTLTPLPPPLLATSQNGPLAAHRIVGFVLVAGLVGVFAAFVLARR